MYLREINKKSEEPNKYFTFENVKTVFEVVQEYVEFKILITPHDGTHSSDEMKKIATGLSLSSCKKIYQ